MEQFLLTLADLSLSGSLAILGILIFRCLLRNQYKIFAYILWAIAGIRLLIPITFAGVWGYLFPLQHNEVGKNLVSAMGQVEAGKDVSVHVMNDFKNIHDGFSIEGHVINESFVVKLLFLIWLSGVSVLLVKNILAYVHLKEKVKISVKEEGYYLTDNISGAFVLGYIHPRIYISSHLKREEQKYILAHETVHLRRRDYLWKGLAELILCFHWFNPLVWFAFQAFTVDMEMSCDEAVLRNGNRNVRAAYAKVLLTGTLMSEGKDIVPFFKKDGTEGRIHNMMKDKKSDKKKIGVCVGAVIAAGVLLLPGFWAGSSYGKEAVLAEDSRQQEDEIVLQNGETDDKIKISKLQKDVESLEPERREVGYPTSQYNYELDIDTQDSEANQNYDLVLMDITDNLGGKIIKIAYKKDESEKLAIKKGYHAANAMVFTADLELPTATGKSKKYTDMNWYLSKGKDGQWRIDDSDMYRLVKK